MDATDEVVNTGVAVLTLQPFEILTPTPSATYLGVSQVFLPAIRRLIVSPDSAIPHAFLCAHALECALKAYLSRSGDDSRVRAHNVRHDLCALWAMAESDGLAISIPAPQWVECLSGLHKPPYYLRYAPSIHIIGTPPPGPMTTELEKLVRLVTQSI